MKLPQLPPTTKPFLWGAVTGAIALSIFGFNWGGWVTGGTAEKNAVLRADKATVSALTPICISQFQASAKAPASLAALKATKEWEQTDFVLGRGWATIPGGKDAAPNRDVASACAEALNKL